MRRAATLTLLLAGTLAASAARGAEGSDGSFVVRSCPGGLSAASILERCTALRRDCHTKWLGDKPLETWRPACLVVVHSARASYEQAVGRGTAQTSGSSLVNFDKGKVSGRRIDLMLRPGGDVTALAHELTHVVLADLFAGKHPRWADEGISLLADASAKQSLHERDCLHALRSGSAMRLHELITLNEFRSREQVAAFYGQSHSLVRYLTEHHEPSQLIPFLQSAERHGYDQAIRETYGLNGIADLEQRWRSYALGGHSGARVITVSASK